MQARIQYINAKYNGIHLGELSIENAAKGDINFLLNALQQAQDTIAKLQETYTDKHGLIWDPPTAFAYAKACTALNIHREREQALQVALEFYANKDNHVQYYIGDGEPAILEDAGKIARVVLLEVKPNEKI